MRSPRGAVVAALVTVLVAVLVTVLPAAPARAADTSAATIHTRVSAAVAYVRRQHESVGVAVIDTRTGALYLGGAARQDYVSASVVKVLIATRLLLMHRMTGHTAALARLMIRRSDNAAASALYKLVGRDALLPWIARHYRLTGLGTRPLNDGLWGTTQLTARGLALLYAAVRKDKRVWPWLSTQMHHYGATSTAGEPNAWGVAAAAPTAGIKNGWVVYRDATTHAFLNTTGYVDHDRYAVVILTRAPQRNYYRAGERIASRAAALLMPHGGI